jgi:hypothetical protein
MLHLQVRWFLPDLLYHITYMLWCRKVQHYMHAQQACVEQARVMVEAASSASALALELCLAVCSSCHLYNAIWQLPALHHGL